MERNEFTTKRPSVKGDLGHVLLRYENIKTACAASGNGFSLSTHDLLDLLRQFEALSRTSLRLSVKATNGGLSAREKKRDEQNDRNLAAIAAKFGAKITYPASTSTSNGRTAPTSPSRRSPTADPVARVHLQPPDLPGQLALHDDVRAAVHLADAPAPLRLAVLALPAVVGPRGSLVEDVDAGAVAEALEVRLPVLHPAREVVAEVLVVTPAAQRDPLGTNPTLPSVHLDLPEARASPARFSGGRA